MVGGVLRRREGGAQVADDVVGADEEAVAVLQRGDDGLAGQREQLGAFFATRRDVHRDVREAELGHHLSHEVAVGAPLDLIQRQRSQERLAIFSACRRMFQAVHGWDAQRAKSATAPPATASRM